MALELRIQLKGTENADLGGGGVFLPLPRLACLLPFSEVHSLAESEVPLGLRNHKLGAVLFVSAERVS